MPLTIKNSRALILAAGKGTRMKSSLPKMAHDLLGKPLVRYAADACVNAGIESVYVVIGSGAEHVKKALGDGFHYVYQYEQLGTGHAAQQVLPLLKDFQGDLLILVGDCPFITPEVLRNLVNIHRKRGNAATFLTAVFNEPPPYGRIVRDKSGRILKIVEEKDADETVRAIKEVNTSHYCFKSDIVFPLLSTINNNNAQGEYLLTDIVEILVNEGHKVESLTEKDNRLVLGVNSKEDLEKAADILKQQAV